MGRHVEALLSRWSECSTGVAEDMREAIFKDEVERVWLQRPPTPDEILAHHETHRTPNRVSMWLAWGDLEEAPNIYCYHSNSAEIWLISNPHAQCAYTWWRPLNSEGVACEWPSDKRP